MSRRFQNWPGLLAEFIESHRTIPFAWGSQDCCLLTCDWIKVCTGLDPAEEYRGKYDSLFSASRLLTAENGVEGIAEKQFAAAGFKEIVVPLCQRGDVVLLDIPRSGELDNGPALGICEGHRAVFPGPDGLEFRLTSSARRAWRVG